MALLASATKAALASPTDADDRRSQRFAPSPQASIVRALASAVDLLPARKEECSLVFRAAFWECGLIDISPGALEQPE